MPVPTLSPDSPVWLPSWPGVRVFCSTRQGGVSATPFDTLNLGNHVGDNPDHVAQNRRRLADSWGVQPVFLTQVHGNQVLEITPQTPDGVEADACWTRTPQSACTIMVADCLPVLFYSPQARVVAAAHAGWRGLAHGVLENTLQVLADQGAMDDVRVWLGPCIGPGAFEVGQDVFDALTGADPLASSAFQPHTMPGKYLADLPALARLRLRSQGVAVLQGNDSTPSWCTHHRADVFFSHRRDGLSGRFAAGIALC